MGENGEHMIQQEQMGGKKRQNIKHHTFVEQVYSNPVE